jgi:hypothetical protein
MSTKGPLKETHAQGNKKHVPTQHGVREAEKRIKPSSFPLPPPSSSSTSLIRSSKIIIAMAHAASSSLLFQRPGCPTYGVCPALLPLSTQKRHRVLVMIFKPRSRQYHALSKRTRMVLMMLCEREPLAITQKLCRFHQMFRSSPFPYIPQLLSPKRTKMHFMECPALSVQKSTQRTYVSGALSVQEFHEGLSYVLALSQSATEKDVT